jgi:hypothetical protein
MSNSATDRLIATVRDVAATDAEIRAAAQAFFDAVRQVPDDTVSDAMRKLGSHFNLDDPARGAFLALVCGSLVEIGHDPSTIAGPLIDRLGPLLESSAALADACSARMPESGDEDHDASEEFEKVRECVARTMPAENAAWEALERFWPPALAVLSVSPSARAAARHLCETAARIADYHVAGHWLRLLLTVLDDEPILVIEPETKLGILARISGVVENFQLHVLLMDAFPQSRLLAPRRVSQRVADVARGFGPQQTEDTVIGAWNLYSWRAIDAGFRLPDPKDYKSSTGWIWGEGVPEDIPVFEGRRVILLGPASYQRSWGSQRTFDKLLAKLECERTLTQSEVAGWLERMVAAKGTT